MSTSSTRRDRFRFMLEHAGYCTPPGRAACALELAKAEELLEEAGSLELARLEILDDPEPWDAGDTGITPADFDAGRITGPYWVRVEVGSHNDAGEWEPDDVASCGGITCGPAGDRDPYLRVMAAELALELADELRRAIGDRADMVQQLEQLAAVQAGRVRLEVVPS